MSQQSDIQLVRLRLMKFVPQIDESGWICCCSTGAKSTGCSIVCLRVNSLYNIDQRRGYVYDGLAAFHCLPSSNTSQKCVCPNVPQCPSNYGIYFSHNNHFPSLDTYSIVIDGICALKCHSNSIQAPKSLSKTGPCCLPISEHRFPAFETRKYCRAPMRMRGPNCEKPLPLIAGLCETNKLSHNYFSSPP